MTTASEYLSSFVLEAAAHAPSITVVTLQRHNAPAGAGGAGWAPGIASYAWGIDGAVVADDTGAKNGLRFGISTWFSDRRTNPGETPPAWQQFSAHDDDQQRVTLTPAGTDVRVKLDLLRWNSSFSATSFMLEEQSQQLLFVVPGAGPNAAPAVMVMTLHATGAFGWL